MLRDRLTCRQGFSISNRLRRRGKNVFGRRVGRHGVRVGHGVFVRRRRVKKSFKPAALFGRVKFTCQFEKRHDVIANVARPSE